MKHLKLSLLSILTAFVFSTVSAQSVDDIISKHIDALGGKDLLGKLNSIYEEVTLQVMGNEAPESITILNGKGYKSEAEFNGQKIINCVTEKGGWMVNPMAGASDPTPMPSDQLKSYREQLYIAGPLFNYAENGYKAELQGQEKVGSVNAYKIKLTSKDSAEAIFFIDPTTYFLVKETRHASAMGQDMELTITPSNYKKTDFGNTIPNTIDMDFGGQFQLTTVLKKVEVNKTIDPKIFDIPAK